MNELHFFLGQVKYCILSRIGIQTDKSSLILNKEGIVMSTQSKVSAVMMLIQGHSARVMALSQRSWC